MSEMILSIAAEARITPRSAREEVVGIRRRAEDNQLTEGLPAHQFPACSDPVAASRAGYNPPLESAAASQVSDDLFGEEDRRQRIYRNRTVAMLRRYMRYSIETGRLPSMVGREFFRSNVTRYQVTTFEDRSCLYYDMETRLHRLDAFSQRVLARVVLQECGHEEAAHLLGCTRMTVHRILMEALDELSSILVEVGLLDVVPVNSGISCQGGKNGCLSLSDCEDGE